MLSVCAKTQTASVTPLNKQTFPYALFPTPHPKQEYAKYYTARERTTNMMKVVIVAILALATTLVSAYDPSPLQDFCVAINNTDSAGMDIL